MEHRIVFMGSPEFALPGLQGLAASYNVVGVVTQPDRKSGRGRRMTPPPVKVLAEELGLPVIQPARLRSPEAMEALTAWAPNLIVVAAYGQILRTDVLRLPDFGCINIHASLLPRWRGASPIHHAVLHGDAETGVTIMRMDEGLDTGPMLAKTATPIHPDDTTLSLSERLAEIGAKLLLETLPDVFSGLQIEEIQDDGQSTYAPMLKKEDGALDFSKKADELARQVRAFVPWPGAFFETARGLIKVHRARKAAGSAEPGQRVVVDDLPGVGTGEGLLLFEMLQPAGKSVMPGEVFLQGAQDWANP